MAEFAATRIIPALAGNTQAYLQTDLVGWDHPRSRGEYLSSSDVTQSEKGSSPLSRGIHFPILSAFPAARIIPALAGNTLGRMAISVRPWDHPRSRGEYD